MQNKASKKPTANTIQRKDIYQTVTDTIIQQLEAGTVPWQQPWIGNERSLLGLPLNFTTGNHYRGINIVLLWCSAIKNSYQCDEWASFKQWQSKKEYVRKGEKGSLIVYYDTIEKENDGEIEKIPFLKSSYVFNRSQLAGYVAPEPSQASKENLVEKIAIVEEFVANTKAIIEHTGDRAFYRPSEDKIYMPPNESFQPTQNCTATEGYYSTLMHELTHWTGHEKRLNRTKGKKFGDQNYAVEELVAEFGAAFLCAGFGIATVDKGNHAGYIDNWLKVLKVEIMMNETTPFRRKPRGSIAACPCPIKNRCIDFEVWM
ncbi:antirestriction protein ArdC [Mucilaginibacter gracilis]|uniref:Antirestriction protein ArdC n=1 Tax=Mucilaginibacter gracilis TaxID=423350 RepID=A0A495IZC8_9SPHI|nr:zincin-like metallopeptidase domain-containing protein [Mucilaginibacter gracilis]RKR82037.1 antirestriction protein ArdC [Mucilaginibacter gracilis]